jgi:hypothetical protein
LKNIAALFVLFFSQIATADVFWFLRQEDGNTNWQYVANFSSGILIVALSITAIRLAFTRRAARRYNRDLEEIRASSKIALKNVPPPSTMPTVYCNRAIMLLKQKLPSTVTPPPNCVYPSPISPIFCAPCR